MLRNICLFFLSLLSSLRGLCRCAKARVHACHCHLSSLHYTLPLPLVPSPEQSNCSYPTIKTSTTPVVYILASTIPWHGIELPFSPAILLYVRVLVGSCCFACLDVYIHINDHQCSAVHASSSLQVQAYIAVVRQIHV